MKWRKTTIIQNASWPTSPQKTLLLKNQKQKPVWRARRIPVSQWLVMKWGHWCNSKRNSWRRIIIKCTYRDLRRLRSKGLINKSSIRHMKTQAMWAKFDCINKLKTIYLTGVSFWPLWAISSWSSPSYCSVSLFYQCSSIATLLSFRFLSINRMQEDSFQLPLIVPQHIIG